MAPKVFKERGPNPLSVMAIFHPFLKIKRKKSPVHNFTVLIPTHLQTSLTLKSEATGQESSARPTYPHRTGSEREPAHLPPPHGLREGACAHSDILSISSVQSSVESDSLQPKGLQHATLPCPSPTPGAYSNSCSSSRWCLLTISSSVIPFSSHLQSSVSIRVFSNESVLRIRWPEYWSFSFSISLSSEYSGLISFKIDWFDLLAIQGTLKSLP